MNKELRNLPNFTTVLGHKIRIEIVEDNDELDWNAQWHENNNDPFIQVSESCPAVLVKRALFHELIHAALCLSGTVKLIESEDEKIEEAIVSSIENALGGMISLNLKKGK